MKSLKTRFRLIPLGVEEAPPVTQDLPSAIDGGLCVLLLQQAPRGEKPETGEVREPRLRWRGAYALPGSSSRQLQGRAPAAKKQLLKE